MATTNTLTGDKDWDDATAWSEGTVVTAAEKAVIDAGATATVPAGVTGECVSLTVNGELAMGAQTAKVKVGGALIVGEAGSITGGYRDAVIEVDGGIQFTAGADIDGYEGWVKGTSDSGTFSGLATAGTDAHLLRRLWIGENASYDLPDGNVYLVGGSTTEPGNLRMDAGSSLVGNIASTVVYVFPDCDEASGPVAIDMDPTASITCKRIQVDLTPTGLDTPTPTAVATGDMMTYRSHVITSLERITGAMDGAVVGRTTPGSDKVVAFYDVATQAVTSGATYPAHDYEHEYFTPGGMFLTVNVGSTEARSAGKLYWSPDGVVAFSDVTPSGGMYARVPPLPHSLCWVGPTANHPGGVVFYFEYCSPANDPKIFYSTGGGKSWDTLMSVPDGIISHFHGGVWVEQHGKLYVMTGDTDAASSVLICDDIDDLIANPDTWQQRWGLGEAPAEKDRAPISQTYCCNDNLDADGIPADGDGNEGQEYRWVSLAARGDWIYAIIDSGSYS